MPAKLVKIIRPDKLELRSVVTFILIDEGQEVIYKGNVLRSKDGYYINFKVESNNLIFELLKIDTIEFQKKLGIDIDTLGLWPYAKTLEILEKQLKGLEEYCIKPSKRTSEISSSIIITIRKKKQPTKFNFKL